MGTLSFLRRPTMPPSTGEARTLLPQLRTKLNAVHAGLSPPPVPSKVLMPSRLDPSNPSLSNNSSLAPSKTLDAMVDSWTMLSCTLLLETHSSSSQAIHTLPELEELPPANTANPEVLVPFPDTEMSLSDPNPNSRPPLLNNQSLLPSKPIKWPSKPTPPVSSHLDAEPDLTTVSSLSDTEP